MEDKELNQKFNKIDEKFDKVDKMFENQTRTILGAVGELHKEAMQEIQRTKLEIFDKITQEINESETRLTNKLASKETVTNLDQRVTKLEKQIA